ncbi:amidohydrolase family protein [Amaricoccus macauensis]|uniref:amidohydrolase family protein n=1 Tax=Amaricoccus macauensis TaxID=57001 RepID=UPI003C7DC5D4
MSFDFVITNAIIVTADESDTVVRDGALAVSGGRIAAIGPAADLSGNAGKVIDAAGMILMPGLINTHCHAADSLFRGLIEDLPLEPWLQTVWKAEGAILNRETVRLGARLGFSELLLGGVTTVMDMFWHPTETVGAARDVGLRVSTGGIFFDFPGMDKHGPERRVRDAEAFFEEFGADPMVLPGTFPHGAYTVNPENLRAARDATDRHGGLFCTHAAETKAELADIESRYGRTVIRHLEHLGLLDERAVLAHCVWLDDEEIDILARRKVTVAHNPMSNLKLASGFARIADMLAAGVRVTVGTDGAISGNDLDMWMALRMAATMPKATTLRADAVTTAQALRMVTQNGAEALGAGERIGSLEVGKEADMILLATDRAHAVPMFDPMTHIVYSAAKSDVRHVFVAGEQVVRDGALVKSDLAETLAAVRTLEPAIAASIA